MPRTSLRSLLVALVLAGVSAPAVAADVTLTFSGQAQLGAAGLGTSSFSGVDAAQRPGGGAHQGAEEIAR